jgi:hypothetical protein
MFNTIPWAACSNRLTIADLLSPIRRESLYDWPGSILAWTMKTITLDEAQTLAIDALVYLAGDQELMPRFLALTGITADQIRVAAGEPGFLAGVLQFYLAHEPTLVRYCEDTNTDPRHFREALFLLPGGAVPD